MSFLENIFKVTVEKTAQGLGLSVTGGVAPSSIPVVDGNCSWPGLIRIKKIFVHGAAWQTGKLAVGDVLLAVNGVPLTGSTNYVSNLQFNNYSLLHYSFTISTIYYSIHSFIQFIIDLFCFQQVY